MRKRPDTNDLTPTHGFAHLVPVAKIGEAGQSMTVAATGAARSKIASYLGLEALQSLSAEVHLGRWRGKGVKLTGHFTAQVTQACVVTLEPVEAVVTGDFERRYLPRAELRPGETATHEIDVDPEGEDPAETLERDIDLGEILVEELSLALDPYPRKPGVEFAPEQDTVAKPDNPFAVLAKLPVKRGKGKRRP